MVFFFSILIFTTARHRVQNKQLEINDIVKTVTEHYTLFVIFYVAFFSLSVYLNSYFKIHKLYFTTIQLIQLFRYIIKAFKNQTRFEINSIACKYQKKISLLGNTKKNHNVNYFVVLKNME